MRRLLGSVLPALLLLAAPAAALTACGDDDSSSVAKDPSTTGSTHTSASESQSADPVGSRLVDTITVTAAGGTVSDVAVPLADDSAVRQFLGQFSSDELPQRVQDTISSTDVPDGWELYGAVIAIGCDAPDKVEVDVRGDTVSITAVKVPSPKPECFAAMTTVALVLVDK